MFRFTKGHYSLVFLILVVIDQLTKKIAVNLGLAQLNSGLVATVGAGIDSKILSLSLTGLLVMVVVGYYQTVQHRDSWQKWSEVLFLAGASSNLIDRWRWGGVIDWLPVPLLALKNNLADWLISLALVGAIIYYVYTKYSHSLSR